MEIGENDDCRNATISACSSAIFALIVCLIGAYFAGFRILGRHVAFLYAPVLGLIVIFLTNYTQYKIKKNHKIHVLLTILVFSGWLLSSLRLLTNDTYARDDYRMVSRFLSESQLKYKNIDILLTGNPHTFIFYGLLENPISTEKIRLISNLSVAELDHELANQTGPWLVAYTKPYFFDQAGAVSNWIKKMGSRAKVVGEFSAFTIWQIDL